MSQRQQCFSESFPKKAAKPTITKRKLKKSKWAGKGTGMIVQDRKSVEQIKILLEIFKDLDRPVTAALRKECKARTGLQWPKIYKWLFDRKRQVRYGIPNKVDRLL